MPDSRPFLQPHYYDETFKVRLGLFLNMPFWGSPVIQATDGTLVCPGFSGSTYMQNAWDYVIIGDSQTPGLATVNSRKVLAVDRKKPATKSGQRNTTHGTESAEAEISIMIWTPDQLQQLQKIIKLVFPVSDQRPPDLSATDAWPQAFNVQHPELFSKNITALQFMDISGPMNGPVQRSKVFNFRAVQFEPPAKNNATSTPRQAAANPRESYNLETYPKPGKVQGNNP